MKEISFEESKKLELDILLAVADFCNKNDIKFYMPPVSLCGDNGAMIAAQGVFEFRAGNIENESLNAKASEPVC